MGCEAGYVVGDARSAELRSTRRARDADGVPVAKGVRMTSFVAVKDDLLNAGAEWVDEPVVNCRNIITSRTPDDLTPFCLAIIDAVAAT